MKWIRAYNRRCLQLFLKHVNASEDREKRYMRHVNIFDKVLIVTLAVIEYYDASLNEADSN